MNFSKIKPILNRFLVKGLSNPPKSASRLLLPEKSKNLKVGKIIEIGPGKVNAKDS